MYPSRSEAFLLRLERGRNSFQHIEVPISAELRRLNNIEMLHSFTTVYVSRLGRMQDITTRIHLF